MKNAFSFGVARHLVVGLSLCSRARVARFATTFVLLLAACTAFAQSDTALMPVLSEARDTQELGRLMLSPADRKRLESLRLSMRDPEQRARYSSLDAFPLDDSKSLPDMLSVRGVVLRSGNRSTIWINNQPLYGQDAATSLRDLATRSGVLKPGVRDLQLKVKPGQVIEMPSGEAVDLLPPGSIKIIPPKTGR